MAIINIKKLVVSFLSLFILLTITNCRSNMSIEDYKYNPELVIYIEEAMDEFFNMYPETHITNEILADYKNSWLYKFPHLQNKIDSLFPFNIKDDLARVFFGKMIKFDRYNAFGTQNQEGLYRIISSKKNIHLIRLGYYTGFGIPLIELLRVEFADKNYMEHYPYTSDYPESRQKEAKAEFESEILPKIKKCIEIVRQRKKEDE